MICGFYQNFMELRRSDYFGWPVSRKPLETSQLWQGRDLTPRGQAQGHMEPYWNEFCARCEVAGGICCCPDPRHPRTTASRWKGDSNVWWTVVRRSFSKAGGDPMGLVLGRVSGVDVNFGDGSAKLLAQGYGGKSKGIRLSSLRGSESCKTQVML